MRFSRGLLDHTRPTLSCCCCPIHYIWPDYRLWGTSCRINESAVYSFMMRTDLVNIVTVFCRYKKSMDYARRGGTPEVSSRLFPDYKSKESLPFSKGLFASKENDGCLHQRGWEAIKKKVYNSMLKRWLWQAWTCCQEIVLILLKVIMKH